jgi:hypothetical protein
MPSGTTKKRISACRMSGFPTSGSGLSKSSEKEEFLVKQRESFAKKAPLSGC